MRGIIFFVIVSWLVVASFLMFYRSGHCCDPWNHCNVVLYGLPAARL